MTRDEVIAAIREIYTTTDDRKVDGRVEALGRALPHPRVADVLFLRDPPLTVEQAADELLAYKPTCL